MVAHQQVTTHALLCPLCVPDCIKEGNTSRAQPQQPLKHRRQRPVVCISQGCLCQADDSSHASAEQGLRNT